MDHIGSWITLEASTVFGPLLLPYWRVICSVLLVFAGGPGGGGRDPLAGGGPRPGAGGHRVTHEVGRFQIW